MTYYQRLIADIMAEKAIANLDPAWVEAWMRLEHATLNSLPRGRFVRETVTLSRALAAGEVSREMLASNAASFGL